MSPSSQRRRAQPKDNTHAIMFVGDAVGCKVKRRHFWRGVGEGNEVGKREDARGSWGKRPGGLSRHHPVAIT